MAELENLEIIIDVVDSFSDELNELLADLTQVQLAIEAVDGQRIDLDTKQAQASLAALQAQLGALSAQTFGTDADASIFGAVGGGGGGGGGGAAAATSGMAEAADEAEDSFDALNIRMTDLHNALARLVPLLLVFIGALPALLGALITLAAAAIAAGAALASVAGFGALGFAAAEGGRGDLMGGLSQAFDRIVEDFLDAFLPLAERLEPLFRDALDGLDRFFQALANQGDALTRLSDEARAFGQWFIDTIPVFLADMADFVGAFSDAFAVLEQWAGKIDIFKAMAEFMADALPPLMAFLHLFAGLIPVLLEISIGFLQAANAVLFLFQGFAQLLDLIPITNEQFGALVGGMTAAYGIALLLNSAIGATLVSMFATLAGRVIGAAASMYYLGASEYFAAVATNVLRKALVALAAVLTLGVLGALLSVVGSIASGFMGASDSIDQATKSLRRFQQQSNRMDGDNPYANPDLRRGEGVGRSRFGGQSITVNIEGDADEETVRNQTRNALYRMERSRRSR